ncbi:hypothetical protein GCM10010172_29950 [Paractinoplanes ferrugineus]|uniref:Uncharacterized protein n=1 Tax=Paractinoplanes ferrugineus TaxID=113564 RepID=A0A919J6Z0_9ACTN|nr:hypothetical protein Afe05nite_74800 [Actinoplanes ferrugineus]
MFVASRATRPSKISDAPSTPKFSTGFNVSGSPAVATTKVELAAEGPDVAEVDEQAASSRAPVTAAKTRLARGCDRTITGVTPRSGQAGVTGRRRLLVRSETS